MIEVDFWASITIFLSKRNYLLKPEQNNCWSPGARRTSSRFPRLSSARVRRRRSWWRRSWEGGWSSLDSFLSCRRWVGGWVNYSGNQMLNTAYALLCQCYQSVWKSSLKTSKSVNLFQQKNLFTIGQAAMHFIKALHVELAMHLGRASADLGCHTGKQGGSWFCLARPQHDLHSHCWHQGILPIPNHPYIKMYGTKFKTKRWPLVLYLQRSLKELFLVQDTFFPWLQNHQRARQLS